MQVAGLTAISQTQLNPQCSCCSRSCRSTCLKEGILSVTIHLRALCLALFPLDDQCAGSRGKRSDKVGENICLTSYLADVLAHYYTISVFAVLYTMYVISKIC